MSLVKSFLPRQISLRTRFILGFGAVLLPFMMAATIGLFYLLPRLIEPLDDIVRQITEEEHVVNRLQVALLAAAMPATDYLASGDGQGRELFTQMSGEVDRAFAGAASGRVSLPEERALIASARIQWLQARALGEALLRLPKPKGYPQAARDVKRFQAHIDRAVALLDKTRDIFSRAMAKDHAAAREAQVRSVWATFGAFAAALAISLFAAAALARSVFEGLDALRLGASRLAAGDLSHRVALPRQDELGELATAFDAMAERLEASQKTLQELATRDGLTGLYNHRMFYIWLSDELARAQRVNRPAALLMIDIDHFKRVNDVHGHLAGDAVLKELGELLSLQARAIDHVCRYGGEEIAVILRETDIEGAAGVGERLRAAAAAQPFDVGAQAPVRITISIGVASWPGHGDSVEALVAAADAALYAAKRQGRNRVVRYAEGPAPLPARG